MPCCVRTEFIVEDFLEQLPQPRFAQHQDLPAFGRNLVNATSLFADNLTPGLQKAIPLQSVEDRVQGSRAEHIAMEREFFDDADTEYRTRACVMQDMEADKSTHQVAIAQMASSYKRQCAKRLPRTVHNCDPILARAAGPCVVLRSRVGDESPGDE